MDERDLRGELGEERRLFDGRVAAAHDGDFLAAEEEAVARRAGGQTVTDQSLFGLESEHQALSTGGNDHRVGGVHVAVHMNAQWALAELDLGRLGGEERGTETGRLFFESTHEFGAHDSLGESGEVLDLGREHQLSAGLIARTRRFAFDDERREVGSCGVDGGGESGRTRSDDDDLVVLTHHTPSCD